MNLIQFRDGSHCKEIDSHRPLCKMGEQFAVCLIEFGRRPAGWLLVRELNLHFRKPIGFTCNQEVLQINGLKDRRFSFKPQPFSPTSKIFTYEQAKILNRRKGTHANACSGDLRCKK